MDSRESTDASRLAELEEKIPIVPDFPKPGIPFRDIFPLFKSPSTVKVLISELTSRISSHTEAVGDRIDAIVGLDARGFLFGPMLAVELGIAFVPVRKKGKLPGDVVSLKYDLEYGQDELAIQRHGLDFGQKVVIVDDLLATGGTLEAACQLVATVGCKVSACFVIVELTYLTGRTKVEKYAPLMSLIKFGE